MGESKPPQFDGRNYSIWAVKMEFYLRGCLLWDHFAAEVMVPDLLAEPSAKDIKRRNKVFGKKHKALSCLHSSVTKELFSRTISCKTAKEAWDKLLAEYQGDEKFKDLQISNLYAESETIRMRDSESIKEFADRIMKIVSQIHILGEELEDRRIVQKMVLSL